MPTDESILGFSNRWYVEGIEKKIKRKLPDGTEFNFYLKMKEYIFWIILYRSLRSF